MAATDIAIAERMQEVKNEIAAKSVQDSDFRAALLSNPGATIEEEYGLEAGALSEIKMNVVVEESGSIVVPIPADMSDAELTDEQLDQVAGGFAFSVALTVGVIAAGATVAVGTATVVQNTRAGRKW